MLLGVIVLVFALLFLVSYVRGVLRARRKARREEEAKQQAAASQVPSAEEGPDHTTAPIEACSEQLPSPKPVISVLPEASHAVTVLREEPEQVGPPYGMGCADTPPPRTSHPDYGSASSALSRIRASQLLSTSGCPSTGYKPQKPSAALVPACLSKDGQSRENLRV